MVVCDLDRPWSDTPFLLQGFCIKDTEDIESLKKYCKYVFIDLSVQSSGIHQKRSNNIPLEKNITDNKKTANKYEIELTKPEIIYEDSTSIKEELTVAKKVHSDFKLRFGELFKSIDLENKVDVRQLEAPVTNMVESILRNQDACIRLTTLKGINDYSYTHCIDSSILATTFGRYLGLPKEDLIALAWGALLFDIGKVKLPKELLTRKDNLTDEEFTIIKKHIDYSVALINEMDGIPKEAAEIAFTHHERFDGSGYPSGLKESAIPVFGRIAGLVDTYDAITNQRPHAQPVSPHHAINKLYEWRNTAFLEELVEAFIKCLGIYPIGTLIELTTGQIGIVISQNRIRHLRPKIMLILDSNKVAYGIYPVIDLFSETEDDEGNPLGIKDVLEPRSYDIEPSEYYI
jgi:HD-GYP domain-containing protein (c-di-GMP phosphodiesterase class II)